MKPEERKRYVALAGEKWAVRSSPAQEHIWGVAGFGGIAALSRPRVASKEENAQARYICWLAFTLVGTKAPEKAWHCKPPELVSRYSFDPSERCMCSLLGEFMPVLGMFRSFECPDTDKIYEFEVVKRRLSILLLRGDRGLLDNGQNIGLYFGWLRHVQEWDLATLGLGEEGFF